MRLSNLFKTVVLVLLIAATCFVAAASLRPVPAVEGTAYPKELLTGQPAKLPWPSFGQSAVGVSGYGVVAQQGSEEPVPVASIAKVITALAVLEKHPLAAEETGPKITITKADVQLFENYFAKGGSVVKVTEGQTLSQYEAMQAMLLPSANNISDTLAIWAFGSLEAYKSYANNMVKGMGLNDTTVDDASGFSPKTVSTAKDLTRLAETAMANPVFVQIVGQKETEIAGSGKVRNVNWLLGADGVNGIKTGNTDEAGGCFMFSAKRQIEGEAVQIVGVVLGAPHRNDAITASQTLIKAADESFSKEKLIKAGEPLGVYLTPWGDSVKAVASKDIELLVWRGLSPTIETRLDSLDSSAEAGAKAGTTTLLVGNKKQTQDVVLEQALPRPSWVWRALQY